jgi:hypothetical protein
MFKNWKTRKEKKLFETWETINFLHPTKKIGNRKVCILWFLIFIAFQWNITEHEFPFFKKFCLNFSFRFSYFPFLYFLKNRFGKYGFCFFRFSWEKDLIFKRTMILLNDFHPKHGPKYITHNEDSQFYLCLKW